jgi:putative transposase
MTFSMDRTDPPHPQFQSDLSEEQWQTIYSLLPPASHLGARRRVDLRAIVNGIRYALRTGCKWRALPASFGNWNTVYGYYREWKRIGVWQRLQAALCEPAPANIAETTGASRPHFPLSSSDQSCTAASHTAVSDR